LLKVKALPLIGPIAKNGDKNGKTTNT